jgi:hypothetical protein
MPSQLDADIFQQDIARMLMKSIPITYTAIATIMIHSQSLKMVKGRSSKAKQVSSRISFQTKGNMNKMIATMELPVPISMACMTISMHM